MSDETQRMCRRCKALMAYVELPDVGRIWQCASCLRGLETDSGEFFQWSTPFGRPGGSRQEVKVESRNPCPECGKPMVEVMMEGFGSRWQCESCRLTKYSSGGVQRWGPPQRTD